MAYALAMRQQSSTPEGFVVRITHSTIFPVIHVLYPYDPMPSSIVEFAKRSSQQLHQIFSS